MEKGLEERGGKRGIKRREAWRKSSATGSRRPDQRTGKKRGKTTLEGKSNEEKGRA